jgi:anaerobic sulfite reductase subunit B
MRNEYLPFASEILDVKQHTALEYTFRLAYNGAVKPGQFFEVSIPKFGEAPISISGIGDGYVELTIRKIGAVTGEVFEHLIGQSLFLRGPYGNGFNLAEYADRELVIVAGGTGVSPVRGVIAHFAAHMEEARSLTVIAGFKTPNDILFRDDFTDWSNTANVILTVDADPDEIGWRTGLVTEFIPQIEFADVSKAAAIVVGPPAMMRFSVKALLERGLEERQITVSYERKMCCGLGKCGHCRIGDKYVCVDGPVFSFTDAKNLTD